jgi:biopolymer transport protein ExbD
MNVPSPYARKRARIEIIPLIDIIFFLLATFVMVSLSMVKNQGIPVRLPRAASAAAQDRSASATITVTGDGAIYLNQTPVGLEELRGRLAALKAASPELTVFLHGDEAAAFGTAIEVLDEVRLLGITTIAIQTQPAQR